MRSRNRAARSNSIASDAACISARIRSFTAFDLPARNARAESAIAA